MSGGNLYNVSDFSIASKWFYNWVEDSSIVTMQPEGSTKECPSCVSSGTLTIKAFDMRNTTPQLSDKLGIHIPITTTLDPDYETHYVHSYWISYRSGVDGDASDGVTIHQVHYELYGQFGAYFYSMLYDAGAHTETKLDSSVGNDSCYHVSPSAYLKDRASDAVEAVQPIICVEGINRGSDVTVSISFLDKGNLPSPSVNFEEHSTIQCSGASNGYSKRVSTSNYNLFHVKNSASTSKLNVALDGASSSAYFYDE